MKYTAKPGGNDQDALFSRNLEAQEPLRWAEFMSRRTRASLEAWRDARRLLQQIRGRP